MSFKLRKKEGANFVEYKVYTAGEVHRIINTGSTDDTVNKWDETSERISTLAEVSNDISSAVSGLASTSYVDGEVASAETSILNEVSNDINSAVSGLTTTAYVDGEVASARRLF